jgi:flagellar biosynthesis protein FlhF
MRRVKDELGQDAVIVHTRERRKPFLGLFGWPSVEVTASSGLVPGKRSSRPHEPAEPRPLLTPASAAFQGEDRIELSVAPSTKAGITSPELRALAHSVLARQSKLPKIQTEDEVRRETLDASAVLDRRLLALEEQLNHLTDLIGRVVGEQTKTAPPSEPDPWRVLLKSQEVEDSLADEILADIHSPISRLALREGIIRRLPVAGPILTDDRRTGPKVVMLVGPTGVGKTTTLAKIAPVFTHPRTGAQKKVVFMTADLFRIAAVEQLQKYSEILRIPLEVVYAPEEATAAIRRRQDADLILVDTGGTGQRNENQVSNLAMIARACKPLEVHLVLSATTKNPDLVDIIDRFRELEPQRILITKLDESTKFGNILNMVARSNLPISYITTGQMVPEDIEVATSERLVDLILSEDGWMGGISFAPGEAPGSVAMVGGADHA